MTHISFISSPAGAQVIKLGSVTPYPTQTPSPTSTPYPTQTPTPNQCDQLLAQYLTLLRSYDADKNGYLSQEEVNKAIQDYFAGKITKTEYDAIALCKTLSCKIPHTGTPVPTSTPTPIPTITPSPTPSQYHTLIVTADPSYSTIVFDNGAPHQAPETYHNVSTGTHNLKVAATGYVLYDSNIYISSDTQKHIKLDKIVPTPFPTVTPPPNNFMNDCVSGNNLTCSWSKLESYLLNKTIGGLWWDLSETIRRKIVKTAIQNSINKNIPYRMTDGTPYCGGASGTWDDAVCVPNSIIRHLKFGYLPNVGQDDRICSPERAYYKYTNSGTAYCFYTPNSYYLPVCAVSAIVPNGFAHALSSIQVNKDTSKISSWIVFQYSDVDIQPGHWQMPNGARIRFSVPSMICKNCIYGTRIGEFNI